MHPLLVLVIATGLVFLLIIRWKVNAFVALIVSAMVIGLLSSRIPAEEVMKQVSTRFGNVVAAIGVVIAMAAIIGQCLMESGAADRVARTFVRMLGEGLSSLSLVITGYVLSIPVFADTVFYLLIPLARTMSVRMGGKYFVENVLAISAGATSTHVFIPPTPGPLAMAATLNIDLGIVILVGFCVAAPASFFGWVYSRWIDRRLNLQLREATGPTLEELSKIAARSESELPSFWASMMPILLPVVLISAKTVAGVVAEGAAWTAPINVLGDPSVALMLAALAAVILVARQKRTGPAGLSKTFEIAIKDAGMIILITAGGGAFGGMLQAAGVGDVLGAYSAAAGIPLIGLGFGLAALFKLAQGSSTVCMITVSSILAPMIVEVPPPYHPVYLLMAVGAGSLVGQWMNDSGFWVYRTMTGLTETETLKTKSAMLMVLGVSGFLVSVLGSWLVPLR